MKKLLNPMISSVTKVPKRMIMNRKKPAKLATVSKFLLFGKSLLKSFTVTLLKKVLAIKKKVKTIRPTISFGVNWANFKYHLSRTEETTLK